MLLFIADVLLLLADCAPSQSFSWRDLVLHLGMLSCFLPWPACIMTGFLEGLVSATPFLEVFFFLELCLSTSLRTVRCHSITLGFLCGGFLWDRLLWLPQDKILPHPPCLGRPNPLFGHHVERFFDHGAIGFFFYSTPLNLCAEASLRASPGRPPLFVSNFFTYVFIFARS